jgi:flagellar biogenesis protein FliO
MSCVTWRSSVWLFLGGMLAVCCVFFSEVSSAVGQVSATDVGSAMASPTFAVDGNLTTSTIRMLGALCFCLGVLAVGVRIARRFAGTPKSSRRRRIEVREKTALSSKTALFLIAIDNREYLVASCSNGISVTPTHSITTALFAESLDEVCQESGELHA